MKRKKKKKSYNEIFFYRPAGDRAHPASISDFRVLSGALHTYTYVIILDVIVTDDARDSRVAIVTAEMRARNNTYAC